MAKIYKTKTSFDKRIQEYLTEELISTGFTHVIDITANLLKYKFIRDEDNHIIYNFSISIDEVKSNHSYSSQCFIIPNSASIGYDRGSEEEIVLNKEDLIFPLNKTIINKPDTLVSSLEGSQESFYSPIKIFVPAAGGDFTNFEYSVYDAVNNIIQVETNSPNTVETTKKSWKEFFCAVTAVTQQNTVNVGDVINVSVQSSDSTLDVLYLEPVVGIIDRTRVNLTNGVGTFNILTTTLKSGDIVDIKLNFKSYTGVARFTKTIS